LEGPGEGFPAPGAPNNLKQFVDDRNDIPNDADVLPRPPIRQATGTSSLVQEDDDSPFRFEPEHHSWLRGIATYDDRQNSWRIQYGTEEDDLYSGQLSIANCKWLSGILNGDIVLLEGRIDLAQRDNDHKPKYVLTKAPRRLVPKPKR